MTIKQYLLRHSVDARVIYIYIKGSIGVPFECTENLSLRAFDQFSDEVGYLADQGFAFDQFFSLIVLLHLSRVSPVHLNDVAAEDAAPGDFFFKAFQEFPGIDPHFHVGLFPDFVPPKKQSDGCKTPYDSAADFPVATQPPAKGVQSLDQIVILFSELFLCDRKDNLASMKAFHEEIHCLFLHLQSRHLTSLLFIFQVNVKRATSSPAFEYPTVLHNTS